MADEWPVHPEFWVEIEDHCEDGNWSGHAHTEGGPFDQFFGVAAGSRRGILKSRYDELADAIRDVLVICQSARAPGSTREPKLHVDDYNWMMDRLFCALRRIDKKTRRRLK